ncbi:MAG TPA: hypothetical protein VM694_33355 [Polyangium sp.]|nr:hypothetical protein [Polyangium sp.]
MAYRLVQRGEGEQRPLLVLYLVGAHVDADLRAAVGPEASIAAYDDATGEPLPQTVARVAATTGVPVGDVILAGFSAGCQAVRRELIAGRDPSGVLAIDGTHGDLPPADWQLAPWRALAERARRGERLFVATCSQNTYVETDLPKGKRYSATVSVLRLALGFALVPSGAPEGEHDGELHGYSYESARTDAEAHIRQQRLVLPDVLRRHVQPWLAARKTELRPEERAMAQAAVALSLDRLARSEVSGQQHESVPPPSA